MIITLRRSRTHLFTKVPHDGAYLRTLEHVIHDTVALRVVHLPEYVNPLDGAGEGAHAHVRPREDGIQDLGKSRKY